MVSSSDPSVRVVSRLEQRRGPMCIVGGSQDADTRSHSDFGRSHSPDTRSHSDFRVPISGVVEQLLRSIEIWHGRVGQIRGDIVICVVLVTQQEVQ